MSKPITYEGLSKEKKCFFCNNNFKLLYLEEVNINNEYGEFIIYMCRNCAKKNNIYWNYYTKELNRDLDIYILNNKCSMNIQIKNFQPDNEIGEYISKKEIISKVKKW